MLLVCSSCRGFPCVPAVGGGVHLSSPRPCNTPEATLISLSTTLGPSALVRPFLRCTYLHTYLHRSLQTGPAAAYTCREAVSPCQMIRREKESNQNLDRRGPGGGEFVMMQAPWPEQSLRR